MILGPLSIFPEDFVQSVQNLNLAKLIVVYSSAGLLFVCVQSGNAQKGRFDLGRPAWTVGREEEVSVNMQRGRMAPSSQSTSV